MNKKYFKEECWILYGIRLGKIFLGFKKYHSKGEKHNVEFSYNGINKKWVIGWDHTHPGERNITPSSTDNKTMRSWVKGFYKSYLCGIECNGHEAYYKYFVKGISKKNVTLVKKVKVKIEHIGPFFVAY
jgi:hypothetical protein